MVREAIWLLGPIRESFVCVLVLVVSSSCEHIDSPMLDAYPSYVSPQPYQTYPFGLWNSLHLNITDRVWLCDGFIRVIAQDQSTMCCNAPSLGAHTFNALHISSCGNDSFHTETLLIYQDTCAIHQTRYSDSYGILPTWLFRKSIWPSPCCTCFFVDLSGFSHLVFSYSQGGPKKQPSNISCSWQLALVQHIFIKQFIATAGLDARNNRVKNQFFNKPR